MTLIDELRSRASTTADDDVEFIEQTLVWKAADRIAELETALRKIADPIAWLKANLEPGQQLDGGGAYALNNDPTWLKKVARDALAPKPTKE